MNGEEKEVNLPVSLRDYFAGQALSGIMRTKDLAGANFKLIAEFSYQYADAMIAERGKK
ncbi:MAG: hypothetical protein ACUZ8H_02720 [Candidatus Anammoxibacter sp.]